MLECLIIGDSIAVGIGQNRPDCRVMAKVGINSRDFVQKYQLPGTAKTTVISLGTNDGDHIHTYSELMKLRRQLGNERVLWVLPSATKKPAQRRVVKALAHGWADGVIEIPDSFLSPDRIHPTGKGYKTLASNIK